MEVQRELSPEDLDKISAGQKAYDYYNKPLKCRKCGYDDFTCLGWKVKPSGNCHEGYEFKCNRCDEQVMVYYH